MHRSSTLCCSLHFRDTKLKITMQNIEVIIMEFHLFGDRQILPEDGLNTSLTKTVQLQSSGHDSVDLFIPPIIKFLRVFSSFIMRSFLNYNGWEQFLEARVASCCLLFSLAGTSRRNPSFSYLYVAGHSRRINSGFRPMLYYYDFFFLDFFFLYTHLTYNFSAPV